MFWIVLAFTFIYGGWKLGTSIGKSLWPEEKNDSSEIHFHNHYHHNENHLHISKEDLKEISNR